MKNYLFILSLLFLTACTNYKKTDLDNYQLKGNVSSVKMLTYYADSKFGEIIKGELLYDGVSVVDFNKSGYITSISSYIKNGNLYSKSKYSYREDKLDTVIVYDSNGDLMNKMFFIWDDDKLLSNLNYDSEGKETFKNIYEYENGYVKTVLFYDEDELVDKQIITKRDGENVLESFSYDKTGKEKGKHINEWDNNIQVKIEYIASNDDSSYSIFLENGLTVKSENCYVLMNSIDMSMKEIYFYDYEFDNKDNWIKCIVFKGNGKIPYRVIEREITYI